MNMIRNWRERREAPRIQIFVHDLSATGVVRNAIALANEASASGYQVRLLTCNAEGVLRSQVGPSVAIVKLNDAGDAGRSRRAQMQKASFAYRRHSREWKPDVMVSAGNHGHLLSSFAWLGLRGKKVLRFSNDLTHSNPSRLTLWWRMVKFRMMAFAADRLVYVSRAQGKHPLLWRQLALGKALVIPNGVDLEAVRAAAAQPCDHPWIRDRSVPVVLAVGRHVKQKNFRRLVEAFARARAEKPMRLIFLGDGESSECRGVEALAVELGVRCDVDFVPATSNPFPYMAGATVLAHPSRWEGSANVLLEALACGTPVVASRTAGDSAHVLDGGRYGVLVDPCDVDELAAALLRQTGLDAVQPGDRVEAFSRRATLLHYVELFDALANQHRRSVAAVDRPAGLRGGCQRSEDQAGT